MGRCLRRFLPLQVQNSPKLLIPCLSTPGRLLFREQWHGWAQSPEHKKHAVYFCDWSMNWKFVVFSGVRFNIHELLTHMPGVSGRHCLPCCPSRKLNEWFFPFGDIREERRGIGLGDTPRFASVYYGTTKRMEIKLSLYIGNHFKGMEYWLSKMGEISCPLCIIYFHWFF